MQRRENAIYTGNSRGKRGVAGDRTFVDYFYRKLNKLLPTEEEIAIVPPDQVNPARSSQDQMFVAADYCVRKILPEITDLFDWGAEVTPKLRALKPVVDKKTAGKAAHAAEQVHAAVLSVYIARKRLQDERDDAANKLGHYVYIAALSTNTPERRDLAAFKVADCVHQALVLAAETGNAVVYDRIIDLINEMLQAL